jgi:hypothetical protein
MEAISSYETSVDFQRATECHIPEDNTLHDDRRENLKFYDAYKFSIAGRMWEEADWRLPPDLSSSSHFQGLFLTTLIFKRIVPSFRKGLPLTSQAYQVLQGLWHSSGSLSLDSHCSCLGLVMWDLRWIKWQWGRFSLSTWVSPVIGQTVPDVSIELNLTPLQGNEKHCKSIRMQTDFEKFKSNLSTYTCLRSVSHCKIYRLRLKLEPIILIFSYDIENNLNVASYSYFPMSWKQELKSCWWSWISCTHFLVSLELFCPQKWQMCSFIAVAVPTI